MLFDSTTNALLSSVAVVQNTAGLMGGGVYLRKQSTYIGFAGVRFEGNTCTRGSGGALYVGAGCRFISIGGLQPLLQTAESPPCTPLAPCVILSSHLDATLTGGEGFTALGFFATFPTRAAGSIVRCTDHAYVGSYKYGLRTVDGQTTCSQEPLDPTTPGVQGEPPYHHTGSSVNVNITHYPFNNNPYITFVVFPYARYDGGNGSRRGDSTAATFVGNTAGVSGGALHVQSSVTNLFVMPGTSFSRNVARGTGGAVFVNDTNDGLYFFSTTFTSNHAMSGGAVMLYSQNAAVQFADCRFTLNTAQYGGAVYLGTSNGNGVSFTETANIVRFRNTTMMYNSANVHGGAVYADFLNSFTFNGSRIAHNIAKEHGGAVFLSQSNGPVTLIHTKVERNQAVGGSGGAVYADTSRNIIQLESTSFALNTAHAMGGAVAVMGGNTLNITAGSCAFTSNSVRVGYGGAIYVASSAVAVGGATVAFVNNSAVSGSALYLSSSSTASFTLANTSHKVRNNHNQSFIGYRVIGVAFLQAAHHRPHLTTLCLYPSHLPPPR
jgi:predicted outer membrane repeat protein